MPTEHTQQCLTNQKAVEDWKLQWPNHCQECSGWGLISSPGDLVPYGMGNTQLPDNIDPCERCLGMPSACPRCGKSIIVDDNCYFACSSCGYFMRESGNTEGMPQHECLCWENDDLVYRQLFDSIGETEFDQALWSEGSLDA